MKSQTALTLGLILFSQAGCSNNYQQLVTELQSAKPHVQHVGIRVERPTSEQRSSLIEQFWLNYRNVVWEVASEPEDITSLAKVVEYRITESRLFADYVEMMTRDRFTSASSVSDVPILQYKSERDNFAVLVTNRIREQLPSDILESRMKKRSLEDRRK